MTTDNDDACRRALLATHLRRPLTVEENHQCRVLPFPPSNIATYAPC